MSVSQSQIDNYITDVRTAVAEYGGTLSKKQRLGKPSLFCDKIKLMLLSGYLDCICDYFLQYPNDIDPDSTNFFTKDEIRDIMQHINNICDTNYILNNL
jgi:hypothetical protein